MNLRRSITAWMTISTAVLIVILFSIVYAWRRADVVRREKEELRANAELTAKLVLRSFEAVEPSKSPVHADYLARNFVELPDIHNIVVVATDGKVAFSHHPDEIGRRFDPSNAPGCNGCHMAGGVTTDSREFVSRDGKPLFHEGLPIPNERACRLCHDPGQEILGMLLISFELSHFYEGLARWRFSFAWSAAVAALASLLSLSVLFRVLVRRPLGRLERDIRRLKRGDLQHLEGPRGEDEIASVHASFVEMAGRVSEARGALENRVREGAERIDSLSGELELIYSNLMHVEHLSAMGTLSAKIAHEIRTPLNAMALNLQLLERGFKRREGGDQEFIELISDMTREVHRIVEILNNFMARVRRPSSEPHPEPVGQVVESAVFLMGAEARRAGVVIEAYVAPEVRSIPAHATHLRQILMNLVSNAVRAASRGGRVRVRTFTGLDGVQVAVEDNGPGVPKEMRQRILEPFFTTRPEGTGLGLAIVSHIVGECGGSLLVQDSRELGGASFTVSLGRCIRTPSPDRTETEGSP